MAAAAAAAAAVVVVLLLVVEAAAAAVPVEALNGRKAKKRLCNIASQVLEDVHVYVLIHVYVLNLAFALLMLCSVVVYCIPVVHVYFYTFTGLFASPYLDDGWPSFGCLIELDVRSRVVHKLLL